MKRLVCTAVALAVLFALVCAADDVGTIGGVAINEEGIVTWDEYPGTEMYWVEVDISSVPAEGSFDLNTMITEHGTYKVSVWAYVNDSQTLIAKSKIIVTVFDETGFHAKYGADTETDAPDTANGSSSAPQSDTAKNSTAADKPRSGTDAPANETARTGGIAAAALVVSCVSLAASACAVILALCKKKRG